MPRTRGRKTAAARYCLHCGYEFARDRKECPMCARFEQLRIELALARESQIAGAHPGPRGPLAVNDSAASDDRPATALEYSAILAARRSRRASADSRDGGTTKVILTQALRQPANRRMEAPGAALAGDSAAAPEKTRRKNLPLLTPSRGVLRAAAKERSALPAPSAHQLTCAPAQRHRAAFSRHGVQWERVLWVVVALGTSALIGASVPWLLSMNR